MLEQQVTTIPQPDRPQMPEGHNDPKNLEGLLDWSYANTLLEGAYNYWIGTTRPDGSPHARPVWGVWLDNTFYFEGNPDTRWGRNLEANPEIVVHAERGDDDIVILEGTVEDILEPDTVLTARLVEAFVTKYDERYGHKPDPERWQGGGLYCVRPRVAFAWSVKEWKHSTTRWRFE